MKCVDCNKKAEYIFFGNSYCDKCYEEANKEAVEDMQEVLADLKKINKKTKPYKKGKKLKKQINLHTK